MGGWRGWWAGRRRRGGGGDGSAKKEIFAKIAQIGLHHGEMCGRSWEQPSLQILFLKNICNFIFNFFLNMLFSSHGFHYHFYISIFT